MKPRCTHTTAGQPCPLPPRLDGACLAHQPARPGPRRPAGALSIAERVQRRTVELGELYPRKTPIAISAHAWRDVANDLDQASGGRP
jgi:hypothetical protein